MGSTRSGGPDGVDPFGDCPKASPLPNVATLRDKIVDAIDAEVDADPYQTAALLNRILAIIEEKP